MYLLHIIIITHYLNFQAFLLSGEQTREVKVRMTTRYVTVRSEGKWGMDDSAYHHQGKRRM